MAAGADSSVDTTCDKLEKALHKQAQQERGEEPPTPFLDTIDVDLDEDSTVRDLTDELFATDGLNKDWESMASNPGSEDYKEGKEVRVRMGVAYFSAWKKALLKFYDSNSDIKAVYGVGMCFINIGAQSVEASRLVMSEPTSQNSPPKA